jgi:MSHA pilin protein MshD
VTTVAHVGRGRRHDIRGVTLIELVVAIAIFSIAVMSVVGALAANAAHSAETMIRQQAEAIAQSYLQEILAKSYLDPDGVNGEAARPAFDNVADYNGLPDNDVRDQFGNAITGLGLFSVRVRVGPGSLGGVPAADVRRIDVTVTDAIGHTVVASGYRTRYP